MIYWTPCRFAPVPLNLFSHCAQKSVYRQFTRKEKGIGRRSFRDRKWVSTKEGRRKEGRSDKAKVDERKRKGEIASLTISISASSAVKGIKNRIKTSFITEGSPVVS